MLLGQIKKFQLISSAGLLKVPQLMLENGLQAFEKAYQRYIATDQNWSSKIPIDFRDLPEKYHPEELELVSPENLELIFQFYKANIISPVTGYFESNKYQIYVRIPTFGDEKKVNQSEIEGTLSHELIHLVQRCLKNYLSYSPKEIEDIGISPNLDLERNKILKDNLLIAKNFSGSPKEWGYKEYLETINQDKIKNLSLNAYRDVLYLLNPAEFFTWLNNAKDRLMKNKKNISKGDFKRFVGNTKSGAEDFHFRILQLFAPKAWERAVKELWKELEDYFYYV